ncbi:MAG: hypothetical protein HF962_04355 [Sulfurovum sp.]|nr:hypothetical protein [Sulfurovum sp.]
MTKEFLRILIVGMLLFFASLAQAKGNPDYRAGYNDGCSSGKGHYTRSAYKYRYSSSYKSAWRKGKRTCTKRSKTKRKIRRKPVVKSYAKSCSTEVPWEEFLRGWDDGLRSAKGRYTKERKGCASYRHGWVSGYRSCQCVDDRRVDTYVEGYHSGCKSSTEKDMIRNDSYFQSSPKYHQGWTQGFKDCEKIDM